jgi:hypothetical protein
MQVNQINSMTTQLPDHLLKLYGQALKDHLKLLGADWYDLLLPETHYLHKLVSPAERIVGVVYGRYKREHSHLVGRGVLVATDQRVLLVDKKPMFLSCDEIIYRVISGVTYSKAGPAGTVTLHTRMGDIYLRTLNHKCARIFVQAIESACMSTPHPSAVSTVPLNLYNKVM